MDVERASDGMPELVDCSSVDSNRICDVGIDYCSAMSESGDDDFEDDDFFCNNFGVFCRR